MILSTRHVALNYYDIYGKLIYSGNLAKIHLSDIFNILDKYSKKNYHTQYEKQKILEFVLDLLAKNLCTDNIALFIIFSETKLKT